MQELIAPRPLRLAATPFGSSIVGGHQRRGSAPFAKYSSPPISDALARLELAADQAFDGSGAGMSASADPERAGSPLGVEPGREALEEFLSILRPSVLLSPASPIARIRRSGHHSASSSLSMPSGSVSPAYERPGHPYKLARRDTSRSASSVSSDGAAADSASKRASIRSRSERESDVYPAELDAVLLASPISRSHTMNPLPRDPCYEGMAQNLSFRLSSRTPSPAGLLLASPALSPAAREPEEMEATL
ncbi:hypothetical protein AURDEDRAFT_114384 [Auricularia subglabra TFB-10046 SS5]|nr:hypothetical protein AURDEDRAFT_114384 [Auricularia subglabra TFB-10046 SS5]